MYNNDTLRTHIHPFFISSIGSTPCEDHVAVRTAFQKALGAGADANAPRAVCLLC